MSDDPDPRAPPTISTPCTGVCRLDVAGFCQGCRRSMQEIAHWGVMDEAERLRLMRDVLPRRHAL